MQCNKFGAYSITSPREDRSGVTRLRSCWKITLISNLMRAPNGKLKKDWFSPSS